jgi:hypothetical protein
MDDTRSAAPRSAQPWTEPDSPPPTIATPFVWAGGSLLLMATTFLVSLIALFRAFGSLID